MQQLIRESVHATTCLESHNLSVILFIAKQGFSLIFSPFLNYSFEMYEIIGNDSTLASTASYNFESSNNHSERQIKSEVLAASPSDFDSLLGELIRVCGQPLPSVKLEPR